MYVWVGLGLDAGREYSCTCTTVHGRINVPLIGHSSVYLTVYIMVECLEGENKIRKEGRKERQV